MQYILTVQYRLQPQNFDSMQCGVVYVLGRVYTKRWEMKIRTTKGSKECVQNLLEKSH
jgi:hypothetical protein